MSQLNDRLNKNLSTSGVRYVESIPTEAGQFGFLFFSQEVMARGGIENSTQLGELMSVFPLCRVMPTLLDPMGIGMAPVGIRLNIVQSLNLIANRALIIEALARIGNLIYSIIVEGTRYEMFAPLIDDLNGAVNCSGNFW